MKEDDIRKREVLNRYLELVFEDAKRIFCDTSKFQRIDCPACGNPGAVHQFSKKGFEYEQCARCETLFVNPRPTYQDLMKIYVDSPSTRFWVEDFFRPTSEARREKMFTPRAKYIADHFPSVRHGRTGDIGTGYGLFLEELKKLWPESDLLGIEPSVEMAAICREKGLKIAETSLEDMDLSERFTLLTSFELFEHLHDPLSFLSRVWQLLEPKGYFFFTTLNGLGFDIQIFWENAKSVCPPHHLNFFNPYSIEIMLGRVGFEVVEISTPGQLDWDIVEGAYLQERFDPGRFFKSVSRHGTVSAKRDLQQWIRDNKFSSHMQVIGRKL